MKTNTLKDHIRLLRLAIELGDTWEQYRLIHAYRFDNEYAYPKDDEVTYEAA